MPRKSKEEAEWVDEDAGPAEGEAPVMGKKAISIRAKNWLSVKVLGDYGSELFLKC